MDTSADRVSAAPMDEIFTLGGEMGALMRTMDWSLTPIGAVATWPQSLRTAVSIALTSRFPMLIWWGSQLTMLYNDAYRVILTSKHPRSMGQAGLECWAEIRDIIGPMLEKVMKTGVATWSEDQQLPLERNGYAEECYFTFSYSPIFDESGGVGGVFTAVTETTGRILSERRMRALRELAADTVGVSSTDEAAGIIDEWLVRMSVRTENAPGGFGSDLPFALLYLLDGDGATTRLAAQSGIYADSRYDPANLDLSAVMAHVAQSGRSELVDNLDTYTSHPPAPSSTRRAPRKAVVLPVARPGQTQPYGFLVAGISAHLPFDDAYASFLDLVAGQVAMAIANARAHEEEHRRAEALAELDRAKTAFFSNISHEFRTPLTLMLGPVEEMRAEVGLPPDRRELLDVVHRNGLRLLRLVNTLLDFARIEAGRVQASYTPVNLAALTTDLASVFRSLIERAGLRLAVDCPPLPEVVYVDRDMWEKIVLNLLSNAFKFTFDGEIAVVVRAMDGHAELEVRDTGVGIPDNELPHIFERFHRVHTARSRTYEGSGIGLSLVQELVKAHGGTITVASRHGEGTTFAVRIPFGKAHLLADRIRDEQPATTSGLGAAPFVEEAGRWIIAASAEIGAAEDDIETTRLLGAAAPPDPNSRESPPAPTSAETSYVLVVDDNADMREYLRRILARRWRVKVAPNGAAALRMARERLPDLILSDIMMPEMDGLELLRALRADPATSPVPVILLSARAGQEAAIEGLEAGADDYLIKPFSAREVEARVASHLELAGLRQATARQASELDAIFNAMTDAVIIYMHDGTVVHMNMAARNLLAVEAAPDASAHSRNERWAMLDLRDEHGELLPFDLWPQQRVLRGEVLTGAQAVDIMVRVWDGRSVQLEVTGAPIRDSSGHLAGGITVCRDVTERREMERRTQESLDALIEMAETLLAAPDDPHAEAGQGDIPSSQATAQRMAELTRRVMGGRQVAVIRVQAGSLLVRPMAAAGFAPEEEAAWAASTPELRVSDYIRDAKSLARLYAGEPVVLRLDQPAFAGLPSYGMHTALVVLMAVRDQPLGVLLVGYGPERRRFSPDELSLASAIGKLTAIVLMRDRLLREREEARAHVLALQEANRRMDEFLGIAGHELRTPVTALKTNLQMLSRRLHEREPRARTRADLIRTVEMARQHLEMTERGLVRLTRLVDDLVDVSRIQAGKLEMRPERQDLVTIVHESVEEQRQVNPARTIRLEVAGDGPIMVHVDADRIRQVVTNYLSNALKYSAAEHPVMVHVHVEPDGTTAKVRVRDKGSGLAADQQERIWEPFYRVEGAKVSSGSGVGLGLGLHICRTIVEHHQGKVGVESQPEHGSMFWFTLPLSSERDDGGVMA